MEHYLNKEKRDVWGLRVHSFYKPILHISLLYLLLALALLSGCGGSGGDDDTEEPPKPITLKGVFIDATVEGLICINGETTSYTNSEGEFTYEKGSQVSFYIGEILLGMATSGDSTVTPLDLVSNGTIDHTAVLNIARFLQTLDVDPADDHIQIPLSVHALAEGESLSFSSSAFDTDAERIIRLLTESNPDYDAVPSLVSADAARTHLAETLGIPIDDDDPGDNDDDPTPDDDEPTILTFTSDEVVGTWTATVAKNGFSYVFYYHFSADKTGTIVYTAPYPITDPQAIDWEITAQGNLLYNEYPDGKKESTLITRYSNGEVIWSTIEGEAVFTAIFEKQTDPSDDDDDDDDNTDDTAAFIGKWTATDDQVESGQGSQGIWNITESYGKLSASGQWTATISETQFGDVTIEFPFTNASVTISSGQVGFKATGTATATATQYPVQLQSGFTLTILNGTETSCDYKIAVTSPAWNQIIPPDADGNNYSGSASVVIQ